MKNKEAVYFFEKKYIGMAASALAILGVLMMATLATYSGKSVNLLLTTVEIPNLMLFFESDYISTVGRIPSLFGSQSVYDGTDFNILSLGFIGILLSSVISFIVMKNDIKNGQVIIKRIGQTMVVSCIVYYIGIYINLNVVLNSHYNFGDFWTIGPGSLAALLPLSVGSFFTIKPEMVK